MFRSVFLEDIARLYRHGLLPGACARLATRWEMGLAYACIAAVFFFVSSSPRTAVLLGFLALVIACAHVGEAVVQYMTPLCFGSFQIGRLRERQARLVGKAILLRADFILVSSGEELCLRNLAAGTPGMTYLLIRHPGDPSIVLAIIDDNPRYMKRIMVYATDERRAEIAAEIAKLRRTSG
jgi:hypothetical protein